MKTKSILFAAVLASPALLSAQTSSYSITADLPYVTKYVFRGIQYADDSIQPSLQFSAGGFHASLWTNQPVSGHYDNEFDYGMGYGFDLATGWSMDIGATYYDYPETGGDASQFEPYVSVTGDLGNGFSSTTSLYYETQFAVTTLQTSLAYTLNLARRLDLELGGDLGGAMVSGDGDYTYWALRTTLRSHLNDKASAYLGVTYSNTDLDHSVAPTGKEVYFLTTGLSLSL